MDFAERVKEILGRKKEGLVSGKPPAGGGDNKIIAVQGGEYVIPKHVVDAKGADYFTSIIKQVDGDFKQEDDKEKEFSPDEEIKYQFQDKLGIPHYAGGGQVGGDGWHEPGHIIGWDDPPGYYGSNGTPNNPYGPMPDGWGPFGDGGNREPRWGFSGGEFGGVPQWFWDSWNDTGGRFGGGGHWSEGGSGNRRYIQMQDAIGDLFQGGGGISEDDYHNMRQDERNQWLKDNIGRLMREKNQGGGGGGGGGRNAHRMGMYDPNAGNRDRGGGGKNWLNNMFGGLPSGFSEENRFGHGAPGFYYNGPMGNNSYGPHWQGDSIFNANNLGNAPNAVAPRTGPHQSQGGVPAPGGWGGTFGQGSHGNLGNFWDRMVMRNWNAGRDPGMGYGKDSAIRSYADFMGGGYRRGNQYKHQRGDIMGGLGYYNPKFQMTHKMYPISGEHPKFGPNGRAMAGE